MRTAICLSGLARTYRKAHKAFIHNVVGPLCKHGNVDIFISIWDTMDLNLLARNETAPCEAVDINEMVDMYHPVALDVERFDPLLAAFQLHRFTVKECPVSRIVRNGILCAMPAQYKIMRCNDLKHVYEQLNGFRYDLVIRTRLDFTISPLRVDEIDATKLNCLYDQDGLIGDYFYASNSENIDKVTQLFNHYTVLLGIEGTDMGPERNLKNHVSRLGIETAIMRGYTFCLVKEKSDPSMLGRLRRVVLGPTDTTEEFRWDEATKRYQAFDRVKGVFYK